MNTLKEEYENEFEKEYKNENDFENYNENDYENEKEIITMDTPIPSSNIGYKLLQKMGWKEKTSLGREGKDSLIEPLQITLKNDNFGLGQQEIFDFWTCPENIKRKMLNSEIIETEEQKIVRKIEMEKKEKIKEEILIIYRPFYCELCDKQYKRANEFDTHLSSYDHHHTKVKIILKY